MNPTWKSNVDWINDERLGKINAIRAKNERDPLSREELQGWLVMMNERDMRELREAIGEGE